jgi:hypothetical protein
MLIALNVYVYPALLVTAARAFARAVAKNVASGLRSLGGISLADYVDILRIPPEE